MFFSSLLFSLLIAHPALTAPTPPLDAATLLQNGYDAQDLNSQFAALKATDPCSAGQTACIAGALAQCAAAWATTPCPATQQCFALPSVRAPGTLVACTSEASALSLLNATGAAGGLTASAANTTVPFPTANATSTSNSNSTSGPSSSSNSTAGPGAAPYTTPSSAGNSTDNCTVTVTVTLTPTPGPTPDAAAGRNTTLPPETRTLSPAEASALVANATASSYCNSSDASVGPVATPAVAAASGADAPGTTIFLNGPAASPAAEPAGGAVPVAPGSATPTGTGGYNGY